MTLMDLKSLLQKWNFQMRTLFKVGACFAAAACTVMAVPQVSFAVQPTISQQSELAVHDISLAKGGVLKGQIVTSTGQPRSNVPVILGQKGKELAESDYQRRR